MKGGLKILGFIPLFLYTLWSLDFLYRGLVYGNLTLIVFGVVCGLCTYYLASQLWNF